MIKLRLEKQVSSITDSQLQSLVLFSLDVILKSKADNTIKPYISGFNLWRAWAENVEGTPTKPIYLALFFVSHIQSNSSDDIILRIFYGVRWVHRVLGLKNPYKNSPVVNVREAARRILSKCIFKRSKLPHIICSFYSKKKVVTVLLL